MLVFWMLAFLARNGAARRNHGGCNLMHLGRALLRYAALITVTLLAGQAAANDLELPSDAVAMVEHAAVVQQMIDICGRTRPDLLGSLRQANVAWWQRNTGVSATMQKLLNTRESSSKSNELLAHYAAVYHRLEEQAQDLGTTGQTCETLLDDMAHGKMDYSAPVHPGDPHPVGK